MASVANAVVLLAMAAPLDMIKMRIQNQNFGTKRASITVVFKHRCVACEQLGGCDLCERQMRTATNGRLYSHHTVVTN